MISGTLEYMLRRDRMASLHPELYHLVCESDPDQVPKWVVDGRFVEAQRPVGSERFTGLSSLQASLTVGFRSLAQNNLTGSANSPLNQQANPNKNFSIGTTAANNTSGGADEGFSFQSPIGAGAAVTINLNAMTNQLQIANVALARTKGGMFRLLSLTDDPTINANTNTSSKVCITNNGPTTPAQLNFGSGGSGLTLNITNAAGGVINTAAINTNGSGYLPNTTFMVSVNQVNGAQAAISVNTNAAGIPTAVVIANGGTGYVAGNSVPTTELGAFWLQTGNAQMLIDVTALGVAISNASKNVLIQNMDSVNPVTPEIDVIGATT